MACTGMYDCMAGMMIECHISTSVISIMFSVSQFCQIFYLRSTRTFDHVQNNALCFLSAMSSLQRV